MVGSSPRQAAWRSASSTAKRRPVAQSGRYKTVSVTYKLPTVGNQQCVYGIRLLNVLPDGVIGNTWLFGGHIPGSSPGRVDLVLF